MSGWASAPIASTTMPGVMVGGSSMFAAMTERAWISLSTQEDSPSWPLSTARGCQGLGPACEQDRLTVDASVLMLAPMPPILSTQHSSGVLLAVGGWPTRKPWPCELKLDDQKAVPARAHPNMRGASRPTHDVRVPGCAGA
eukprot:571745-Amphidinium_carterae.1